eukprot:SM000176S03143  [mRNA]  locus=s176:237921:239569:+ [translate_table: standard]
MAVASAATAAAAAAAASPPRCCVRASNRVGPRRAASALPPSRASEQSAAPPTPCRCGAGEAKAEATVGRRQALGTCFQIAGVAAVEAALRALPASADEAVSSSAKTTNLSIDQIKTIIERDISEGQYFVTGDLTREIYRDDCRFKDPTNETVGLDKYLQAVGILFDPRVSKQELRAIRVTGPDTIHADWTLGGYALCKTRVAVWKVPKVAMASSCPSIPRFHDVQSRREWLGSLALRDLGNIPNHSTTGDYNTLMGPSNIDARRASPC